MIVGGAQTVIQIHVRFFCSSLVKCKFYLQQVAENYKSILFKRKTENNTVKVIFTMKPLKLEVIFSGT